MNNDKIATVILNPTPSINDNYLWIPEVSDNVVPGLDALLTYSQSKYAALTALHNAITNIDNNIQTEIINIEIPNQGNVNVDKELYYNTIQADNTFQRNNKYTNMITVEVLLLRIIISHIKEKVIRNYKFIC